MKESSHIVAQRPPSTSSWPSTRKAGPASGAQKLDHLKSQTRQSGFPESGQYVYSQELIRQAISNPTTAKFTRSGSSPPRLSSDASLSGHATNAWGAGASTNDVPTLSSLGGVVRSMGATSNALPMTCSGFWPWRLLCRRWLLWTHRPSAGQRRFRAGKSDSRECQTGPSGFPCGSDSTWSPAGAEVAQ
jgi:hypothetical protein